MTKRVSIETARTIASQLSRHAGRAYVYLTSSGSYYASVCGPNFHRSAHVMTIETPRPRPSAPR